MSNNIVINELTIVITIFIIIMVYYIHIRIILFGYNDEVMQIRKIYYEFYNKLEFYRIRNFYLNYEEFVTFDDPGHKLNPKMTCVSSVDLKY